VGRQTLKYDTEMKSSKKTLLENVPGVFKLAGKMAAEDFEKERTVLRIKIGEFARMNFQRIPLTYAKHPLTSRVRPKTAFKLWHSPK